MEGSVCRHFQTGFCKFGDHCQKLHVKEVCEIPSCIQSLCKKRHPKVCKFFMNQQKCKLNDSCAYKHVISKEKSDSSILVNELKSLKEAINVMSEKILNFESEIAKFCTKSPSTSKIETKQSEIEVEKQNKCDKCDFETFCGPKSLKFHKKWVHSCREFKCRLCEFISTTLSIMNNHIFSKHKIRHPNAGDFSSSSKPMCETCMKIENLTPAEFEWPSFTMPDKLKCRECLELNLYWWTEDCKRALPEDIIHIESLEPAML